MEVTANEMCKVAQLAHQEILEKVLIATEEKIKEAATYGLGSCVVDGIYPHIAREIQSALTDRGFRVESKPCDSYDYLAFTVSWI
jgi:hypothetical protein